MNSDRTVVLVSHPGGQSTALQIQLLEPDNLDGALQPCALAIPADLPDNTAAAVRLAGQALYNALTGHAAIADHLGQLLDREPPPNGHCLAFQLADVDPGLVWEGMCPPDRRTGERRIQLGLDPRFEIVRSVRPLREVQLPSVVVDGPLRWTGILAATGPPGNPEEIARELTAALSPLDDAGIALDVTVLVAWPPKSGSAVDEVLGGLAHIQRAQIVKVPPHTDELVDLIVGPDGGGPNILHLYCHGQSSGSGAGLHVAISRDIRNDPDNAKAIQPGSIVVTAADLVRQGGLANLCLAIVNACKGGDAPGGRSLAHSLVRDAGIPYVVAHREPVDAADAHVTAKAVAESLATVITSVPDSASLPPALFFPRLVAARRRLSTAMGHAIAAAADDNPRWTVPVLFARSAPLHLTRSPKQVEAAVRDMALRDMVGVAGSRAPALVSALGETANAQAVAGAQESATPQMTIGALFGLAQTAPGAQELATPQAILDWAFDSQNPTTQTNTEMQDFEENQATAVGRLPTAEPPEQNRIQA